MLVTLLKKQYQSIKLIFIQILGAVDLSRLLLQQLVWYLDKAEYVTCSWLLEHTITPYKFQTSAAL